MSAARARLFAAEAVGTALLVATVIGSGIMAEQLAAGNDALALLCNTLATGCILVVLILPLASVAGALLSHAVFEQPLIQIATTSRTRAVAVGDRRNLRPDRNDSHGLTLAAERSPLCRRLLASARNDRSSSSDSSRATAATDR